MKGFKDLAVQTGVRPKQEEADSLPLCDFKVIFKDVENIRSKKPTKNVALSFQTVELLKEFKKIYRLNSMNSVVMMFINNHYDRNDP